MGLNSAVWSYGPPIEIVGCITSHAQITTTTYFSGAVNSEVAHLIMVCWAFLLQSFGAEQIGDTKWPTKVFAHACVEIQSMSTPFMCAVGFAAAAAAAAAAADAAAAPAAAAATAAAAAAVVLLLLLLLLLQTQSKLKAS